MRLVITLDSDDDAFRDDAETAAAEIVRSIAIKVEKGETYGVAFDLNGNRAGTWSFSPGGDDEEG